MVKPAPYNVFVSYSHRDHKLVTPVVRLLRATKGIVFQDVDDIETGKKWRKQIDTALTNAHLVVVFWCSHSQSSDEVVREYRSAIDARKDVLPVLLDNTPLPSDLGEFHGVDFRDLAAHDSLDLDKPRRSSSRMLKWGMGLVIVVGMVISILAFWFLLFFSQPLAPPSATEFFLSPLYLVFVAVVLWLVGRGIARAKRRRKQYVQIAEKLRSEVVDRVSTGQGRREKQG